MTRTLTSAALTALILLPATALGKPAGDASTLSTAVTPEVLAAITTELERSMDELEIPGFAPGPYLVRYKLTEVEVNDVAASLGATTSSKANHFVNLEAYVHVGGYQLDNSNFAIPGGEGIDGVAGAQLPLEPNARIARRAAWLATDQAYKEALSQLQAKLQFRGGAGSTASTGVASYAQVPPVDKIEPVLVPALESPADMEKRAQKISAAFRDQAHVRESRVAFTSFLERRWYLTSEGTRAHDTRRVSGVIITASSQASDGQMQSLYFVRYGFTAADLPSDDELIAEAGKLARHLDALRTAPLFDEEGYTGPVLFEGTAAADLIRHTLSPHLGGSPVPEGLERGQARAYGGGFAGRIGKGRVLAGFLGLVDDPTARRHGKAALIGAYNFDDEGVTAQRVSVVDRGKLETLLMGRIPSRKISQSNGHARRYSPAGGFHGSSTNLFVSSKKSLSRPQLVRQLLAAARDEGLPYAMIIRQLDDGAITATSEQNLRELRALINQTDVEAPPPAVLAYRVYPNGKEELVRGVELGPVDLRVWKDVIATGQGLVVHNFLASQQNNLLFKVRGLGAGFVPSSGVESAIVTPDLLIREIELLGSDAGRYPQPAVPRPIRK